ncbi:hypothetical protein KDL01_38990 [Actinospica durhamensis]|uniref:Uncharacterized protein n=1 Tax=Actinospica durhamensis TaxID=1508375 RepID=A0A941EW89_9ACTN|nr:hypothetical protein [Actinospica durhamensis]MBR7839312.1 hypothetical protein [Actinospica durhamensis]
MPRSLAENACPGRDSVGGLWRRIKQFSIWRVPNYFIEPSDAYLGEPVESIDRLGKVRSWAAIAIIVGTAVYYSGLSHLGTITDGKDHVKTINIGNDNPEGNWFLGLMISVVTAVFILPVVSLCLVWWTRRGARRAALIQLRWPYIAIAAWFGIFAAAAPFIALGNYLQKSAQHLNFELRAAAWMFVVFIMILELAWIVKSLYLAATGLFRAADGHPLLPLIAAPAVAAMATLMMNTVGGNGLVGVPGVVGDALTWGGTITITIVSLRSAQLLRRRYPQDFPFRNGPLRS